MMKITVEIKKDRAYGWIVEATSPAGKFSDHKMDYDSAVRLAAQRTEWAFKAMQRKACADAEEDAST